MQKYFNITGFCYPEYHYMVDLKERLILIEKLINRGEYFVINRARQYGKSTLLWALNKYLQTDYTIILLSFQRISSISFENESLFAVKFAEEFLKVVKNKNLGIYGLNKEVLLEFEAAIETKNIILSDVFHFISKLCDTSKKPIILMIDEVDHASNNKVFLDFLALLRDYYLYRQVTPALHSVILAGVYDIKNLKLKIRPEEEHRYNSPWNIAADFDIDMSFSVTDIYGMLLEYKQEHKLNKNMKEIAEFIYDYTSGYPYMVSYICKFLDERLIGKQGFPDLETVWTKSGILEAVNDLVNKPNSLSDDMVKKLTDYPELKQMIQNILFNGIKYPYNPLNSMINIATMFGLIKEQEKYIQISNRIIETQLYNLFLSEEFIYSKIYQAASSNTSYFIGNHSLNMKLILEKFTEHFTEIYADSKESFLEENGRRFFLLYLKPIINGVGNYYIESRTRNQRRTDIIIDYCGKQYIIEMKIWHGEEYNQRGEEQLADYLEYYHLTEGYLLSFNFNKKKSIGIKEIQYKDKKIIEAVV